MKSIAAVSAVGALLLALAPATLDAHEKGAITLNTTVAMPGGSLEVAGTRLGAKASVRLELRGALSTFTLGRFSTDTAGRLQQRITIPAAARPGQYSIAAVASDGEVTAQVDLMIANGPPSSSPQAAMPGTSGMPSVPGPHASAQKMNIPISITPAGRAVIWLVVLLSAIAGVLLVRGTSPREA